MSTENQPKPALTKRTQPTQYFTMRQIMEAFYPDWIEREAETGRINNTPVIKAFREGRIIGLPRRWRQRNGEKRVVDFVVTRGEWARLHREGFRLPAESEVSQ